VRCRAARWSDRTGAFSFVNWRFSSWELVLVWFGFYGDDFGIDALSDRVPYCLTRSTLLVEPGTPVVEKS